jgi:polyferredoxin
MISEAAAPLAQEQPPAGKPKKKLRQRVLNEPSQRVRATVQIAFLALNVWLATQFYFFVRQFETGSGANIARPAGVEGWLPIAGLMNLKYFLLTGQVPAIHPAAMFLIATFLTMSLLLRKAFCGWFCPVGTISEWLWKFGRKTFRRNWVLPRKLDIGLRSLKYILLGLFLYAVGSMSAEGLASFLQSPYGIVADVKMLNFFRFLGPAGAVVLGFLVIGSFFIQNLWCRYLCPYGALMGLAALASPLRIKRTESLCIDCAKCSRACPSQLQVDQLIQIRSAECLACMECVHACPAAGALEMSVAGRRVSPMAIALMAAGLFLGVVGWAKLTGHWESPVPASMYQELVPRASQFDHPR